MELQTLKRTVYLLEDLRKISKAVHRIDKASCNADLTNQQEKRRMKLLAEAAELATELGFRAYHQSDPRGCALWLVDNTMDKSNYNEGLALC